MALPIPSTPRLATLLATACLAACGGGGGGASPPPPEPAPGLEVLAGRPGGPGLLDGAAADARFSSPTGLALDATGALWVADTGNLALRRIAPDGTVTTVAGGPEAYDLVAGTGTWLKGDRVARAPDGTVFLLDTDYARLFAVAPVTGVVRTLFGAPVPDRICAAGSCAVSRTAFGLRPADLAVDAAGRPLVTARFSGLSPTADPTGPFGPAERVQRHDASTGAAEIWLAGAAAPPVDGPVGAGATVYQPRAAVTGPDGTIHLSDGYAIRRIGPAGTIATVAGVADLAGDTDGPATIARLRAARAIAADGAGATWVLQVDGRLRRVAADGTVTTEAGAPGLRAAGALDAARGLAVDARGRLHWSDPTTHRVMRLAEDGTVVPLAGTATAVEVGRIDAPGAAARFDGASAVAVGPSGTAYVADTDNHLVRRVEPDGTVGTVAGAARAQGTVDGAGAVARFNRPRALAIDASGTVWVADATPCALRAIAPDGVVRTERRTDGGCFDDDTPTVAWTAQAVAVDTEGQVLVAYGERLARRDRLGRWTSLARPGYVEHLAAGPAGTAVVAGAYDGLVRRIAADGTVTDLAGGRPGGPARPADGRGAQARFGPIGGLAVDPLGRVLVADSNRIRRIDPDGTVTTVMGRPGAIGVRAGDRSTASLNRPAGLAVAPDGTLVGVDAAEQLVFRAVLPP